MNPSTTSAFRSRARPRIILAAAALALCGRVTPAGAHSKESAIPQRSGSVNFKEVCSDHFRLLIDAADPYGKQGHAELTIRPDGTEYPMAPDRRSFSSRSQYLEHVKPIYSVRVYERG